MARTRHQAEAATAATRWRRNRQTLTIMRDRLNTIIARSYGREPSQLRILRDNRDALTWALQQLPEENPK